MCDGCPASWHLGCIPLAAVPGGTWYCPNCSKKPNPRSQQPQPQPQPQRPSNPTHSSRPGRLSHTPKNHNRSGPGRVPVKTSPAEGTTTGQRVIKPSLNPTRHVAQLVNNVTEREVNTTTVVSGGKNGFGAVQDGEIEGESNDGGQSFRVTYAGVTRKADSRSLDSLIKKRIYPHYPELIHKPFHLYYKDDEGEKIDIIDEECFSIFLIQDILDLFVELEQ